jgi:hypothetical protein
MAVPIARRRFTVEDYHRMAEAGIPESWLFDLVGGAIERHSEPGAAGYRLIARAGRGESLTYTMLPTVTLSIDVILG